MQGLSLLELAVVLVILVALATLVVPSGHESSRTAQCMATDATLATLREAIMGGGGQPGYLSDLGLYPKHPAPAAQASPYDLHYLLEDWSANYDLAANTCLTSGPDDPACVHLPRFNPVTQRGWRGPYVQANGARCETLNSALLASTSQPEERAAAFTLMMQPECSSMTVAGGVVNACARSPLYTQCRIEGRTQQEIPVKNELRVALDSFNVMGLGKSLGLRSPILLMKDRQHHYYLVSAGPDSVTYLSDPNLLVNGEVDPESGIRRDDRVLYLDGSDRWGNQPCSQ